MFPQTMCLRVYKVTLVWLFFFGKEAAATKNSWVAAGRSDPHIPRQQPCLAFTVWQQALCLWDQLMLSVTEEHFAISEQQLSYFFDINSQFDLYISSPWAHFSRAWLSGKRLDPIHDFPQQLDGLSRVSIKMSLEKYISVLIISIHTSPDRMVVWPWTGGRESMEWGTVSAAVNTILPS